MHDTSKIINPILEQTNVTASDILYALSLKGITPPAIAEKCGCSRTFVYDVIRGKNRSYDVATYIASQLNTNLKTLWGNTYNYTPRKPQQRLRRAANG